MTTSRAKALVNEQLGHPKLTPAEGDRLEDEGALDDVRRGLRIDPVMAEVEARGAAEQVRRWRAAEALESAAVATVAAAGADEVEVARLKAKGWIDWESASARPHVQKFRADVLRDEFPVASVAAWVRYHHAGDGGRGRLLAYPDGGELRRVRTRAGSVLDRLADLVDELVNGYGWKPDQAVVFVLADKVPVPPWITVTDHDSMPGRRNLIDVPEDDPAAAEIVAAIFRKGRRVILDIDPDVPPEIVAAVYAKERGRRRRLDESSYDLLAEWVERGHPNFAYLARHSDHVGADHRVAARKVKRAWGAITGAPFKVRR